ncbi:hypothetical protein GUJ93_ZPchr0011g27261 [Zizania palustris]|uniref:Protein kinase domain-containing protein n=1 Tax=Zizania palustris TaxID=103762 RepID=A0A8J5WHP6_ZIZPA|nr:hypothetical protein GUJ93_ZPchr0011g27261 [Zizania palustris]
MHLRLQAMTQLVSLLWFFLHSHAAAVALAQRSGCPRNCGDVKIPYPFGIGDECAWPGFTISCNDSFSPSKPYYSNIEIIDISLEKGEILMYTFAAYVCYNSNITTDNKNRTNAGLDFTGDSPFLVGQESNEFTAIGCATVALLQGREDGSFLTGCITTCASLDEAAQDNEKCEGLGCCQLTSIPANLSTIEISWYHHGNEAWRYSPCSYAFVAEKGWYHFSREDFSRNGSKSFVYSDGEHNVPTVVDWAIRSNGSCSSAKTAPACVSNNSYCIAATNGEGYLCNCSAGYAGNPYLTGDDGCTNINECEQVQSPCTDGTCHDLQGSFECKCNFGKRKEIKNDMHVVCRPILDKPAKVVIAITCVIAILSILFILLLMVHEKKRLREIFKKNGGQLLKTKGIQLFTKQEIRKITHNYDTEIGKGGFGKVFKGKIDGLNGNCKQVAVKRSIIVDNNWQVALKRIIMRSITVDEEKRGKDFANEIIIQSEIDHKNVVKLVGCCLETNIPMLVFEYVPKGSLHDVLHGNGDGSSKKKLTLEERLAIAIGSAEALDHMHSSKKILHGDVKPGNILLDDHFVPKVSDFGISRLMTREKDELITGDNIYMDPVYKNTGELTEKSDVYSFGVVLLELITRKKARVDGSLRLDFVDSYKSDSRAVKMFDDEFVSPEAIKCIDMISRIVVQSLKGDVEERPTMKQVLEQLDSVRMEWMQTKGHML